MRNAARIYRHINWLPIICWFLLSIFGWLNIYASVYDDMVGGSIFSFSSRSGVQFLWITVGIVIALLIMTVIPPNIYLGLSWLWYALVGALLVLVLVIGRNVNGAQSWLMIGPFGLQPSELTKITTSLVLSSVMGATKFRINSPAGFSQVAFVLLIPVSLIALEPDMGTVLVYCSLAFMLYREGMSGWVLTFAAFAALIFVCTLKFSPLVSIILLTGIIGLLFAYISRNKFSNVIYCIILVIILSLLPKLYGIEALKFIRPVRVEFIAAGLTVPFILRMFFQGQRHRINGWASLAVCYVACIIVTFSVQFVFDNLLEQHHRDRIEILLGISEDLKGAGYNVHQSEIAIGSGGFLGKGYLEGTQTKFNFVPEQTTDFIFCTIGEEWGFIGSFLTLALYTALILSILSSAEKMQDSRYRIYGYCIASMLFMHLFINVGMTIGIMPVVGIPLPFISYGGSSFLAFTVMLFIFIRFDLERWK